MPHEPKWNEHKLARTNDEELVRLAQRHPGLRRAAAGTLVVRHWEDLRWRVARCARLRGLALQDAEDACQEIYKWIPAAILAYDPQHAAIPCRFRTFLRRVVRSRASNYFDHIERQRSKYDPAVDLNQLVDARPNGAGADPAALAEKQDSLARVAQEKQQLAGRSRWMCDQVAADKSIAALAREMGVSIKRARRARQQALAELRARLPPVFEPGYENRF